MKLTDSDFLAYLVRPGFSVYKVVLIDALQVFVLLQVLTHLHMFWIGLEVGVSCSCCFVRLLQLERERNRKRDFIEMNNRTDTGNVITLSLLYNYPSNP